MKKYSLTFVVILTLWLTIACPSVRPGESVTVATPYGTVTQRGPYVPNPAPTCVTNVYSVARDTSDAGTRDAATE